MAFKGSYVPAQATVRITTASTGKPFPRTGEGQSSGNYIRTPSLTVTAANTNAGTIYIWAKATATTPNRVAADCARGLVPLTKGQSFTFTGVPIGSTGYREWVFGTGYTYILGSATSQRAILTWMEQA